MRLDDLEITLLGEGRGRKYYLALYHGKIKLFARKYNTDVAKQVARIARLHRAKVLVLPLYFNTGPVLEFTNLSRKRYVKRVFEQVSDQSIRALSTIAMAERLNIIVPGSLEKAGAHYYISRLLINHEGRIVSKYRKLILSNIESLYNIVPGKDIGIFNTRSLNIGVAINDEILYPELLRIYKILGSDLVISPMNPFNYKYSMATYIAKSRIEENNLPLIIMGSIIEFRGDLGGGAPTIIYDEEGNKIYEYNGIKPNLILLPMNFFRRKSKVIGDLDRLIHIMKIYRKILRNSGMQVGIE